MQVAELELKLEQVIEDKKIAEKSAEEALLKLLTGEGFQGYRLNSSLKGLIICWKGDKYELYLLCMQEILRRWLIAQLEQHEA